MSTSPVSSLFVLKGVDDVLRTVSAHPCYSGDTCELGIIHIYISEESPTEADKLAALHKGTGGRTENRAGTPQNKT